MKTLILSTLAILALPIVAHAQAFINMPHDVSVTDEVTYRGMSSDRIASGHAWTQLDTLDGEDYGVLICADANMKARIEVDGEVKTGYFDFDSKEKCDETVKAIELKPRLSVRFTFVTDPTKKDRVPGYLGGRVSQVEWLD